MSFRYFNNDPSRPFLLILPSATVSTATASSLSRGL